MGRFTERTVVKCPVQRAYPTTGPFEFSRTIWPALAPAQLFCRGFIVRIFCSPLSLLCPLGFIKDRGSLLGPHNRGKIVVDAEMFRIKISGKKVLSINRLVNWAGCNGRVNWLGAGMYRAVGRRLGLGGTSGHWPVIAWMIIARALGAS